MVRATVAHLAKVIRKALEIAKTSDRYIITMCGTVWALDLQHENADTLCRKLHFLLLHCRITTIYAMFTTGLFHNPDVLAIALQAINQRNNGGHPLAQLMRRRQRKYFLLFQFLIVSNINIFLSSHE